MRKTKPNYGGTGWHVFVNLFFGVILVFATVFGVSLYHPLLTLLLLPSAYFILKAFKWKKGEILEEKLKVREEVIRVTKPKDGEKILDVGTGGGLLAIGFAKTIKDGEIVGIDVWLRLGGGTSIKNAEKNAEIEGVAGRVKFRRADVRSIPYPDNYFDVVVASFVIHIIRKDREKALKEMVRVLKPNGRFTIVEPPKEDWTGWSVDEKLKEKLERLGLKNVRFQPLTLSYPKKRNVYLVYGEKGFS
ncbi:MAG: hypothetical protein DRO36_02640 [Candidatus Hecatellales archaeon]|nr:MAG: hypothetical protein DRO36_02640 [Candidatus Hecatellales archaeon]